MLERLTNAAIETWSNAQDTAVQLFAPSLRLGVTGLARSGKTVFITSLVHNHSLWKRTALLRAAVARARGSGLS